MRAKMEKSANKWICLVRQINHKQTSKEKVGKRKLAGLQNESILNWWYIAQTQAQIKTPSHTAGVKSQCRALPESQQPHQRENRVWDCESEEEEWRRDTTTTTTTRNWAETTQSTQPSEPRLYHHAPLKDNYLQSKGGLHWFKQELSLDTCSPRRLTLGDLLQNIAP